MTMALSTISSVSSVLSASAAAGSQRRQQSPQQCQWANVITHLDPKYGGMSAAVPALSSAVMGVGKHTVSLTGFCAPEERFSPSLANALDVHYMPLGYANWLTNKDARVRFQTIIDHSAGVHIHGLWEQSTFAAARAARNARKPYLVSAHGMLQPWALNNKRWKKAVYGRLIERANLKRARCLHALTSAEARDYRGYGLTNPIAIIPNGVDLPSQADSGAFLTRFPALRNKRLILFLSRVHFKKGLDILCQAWASAAKRWPDAHLVIAGPDFENTRAAIEALVETSGIKDRVTFTGMLDSALKWSALSAAECFVLPSYSEGLSVSVLEAMGMGLPVIVTKQCNLPEVGEHGCGWVIDADALELERALTGYLSAPSSAIAEMSTKGHSLVQKRYSWRVVGEQMSALYSWMQGGPVPTNLSLEMGGKQ
jgi:glycosyltransferase involved in cell wall biosynthesis